MCFTAVVIYLYILKYYKLRTLHKLLLPYFTQYRLRRLYWRGKICPKKCARQVDTSKPQIERPASTLSLYVYVWPVA